VFGKELFAIAIWLQKALFEKVIPISLLRRAFCRNDIIVHKFEKIPHISLKTNS